MLAEYRDYTPQPISISEAIFYSMQIGNQQEPSPTGLKSEQQFSLIETAMKAWLVAQDEFLGKTNISFQQLFNEIHKENSEFALFKIEAATDLLIMRKAAKGKEPVEYSESANGWLYQWCVGDNTPVVLD